MKGGQNKTFVAHKKKKEKREIITQSCENTEEVAEWGNNSLLVCA